MKKNRQTIRKVLHYLRGYRLLLVLSLLLSSIFAAGSLYIPIVIGRAIDAIVGPGNVDFSAVLRCCVTVALTMLACGFSQWCANVLNNHICFHVVQDLRTQAFAHLQELPLSYLDTRQQGDIVSRMIADAEQLSDGLLMGFTQLFSGLVLIFGTFGFMLWLNWRIALLVVLLTPMSLLIARFIAGRTQRMFVRQAQLRGEQTAFLDEMIGNQKLVQAFSRQRATQEDFDRLNRVLEKSSLQATFYSSLVNPTTRFVNNTIYALVALCGALAVLSGGFWQSSGFTVGALASFLSYATQYAKPFNEISGVVAELQNALTCAARLFELIEAPTQSPDCADAKTLRAPVGAVTMDKVCFSYTPDKPLIEDLSLCVRRGQRIAIVGPTGCGKTTLINLLMRFYDVNSGELRVENIPVSALTRQSLRQCYGMVLQDTWLENATVRENIALGRPDATEEEIIQAAKAAFCDGFIRQLPQGYDTVLDDESESLSQGQKQLLCIARVMLCLPPMLILDEATSAIDTRTELQIQSAFARLMEGRTCFIVAHRLSTVRQADCILVMRNGKIIEKGTHTELLAKNGFYTELYNSQFAEEAQDFSNKNLVN